MTKTIDDFVLLTGATGLLGQYLLRDLLEQGHRVAVVVRPNRHSSATERVERTMQMWDRQAGKPLRRPVCLEGDIVQSSLGLNEAAIKWVAEHVGSVMHSAASLAFRKIGPEPWRTNVEGTSNVLGLCQETDIGQMHYVSTAYVCGQRDSTVYEDELDVGQSFRNDYERSKFEAEKAVRDAKFDTTTVYRPVVITGDSRTGYTSTYHGTYLYMKIAKLLADFVDPDENGNRQINIRWGLTGRERRNITHVDWNSTIICKLFANRDAHGRTFHLAPSDPITMQQAIEYANEFYNIVGVEFGGFGLNPERPLSELERWLWANIAIYGSYDFMDPQFDCTNLMKFTPTPPCPKLDRRAVQKLIQFAENDRWGKRKPESPSAAIIDVESFLDRRLQDPAHGLVPSPRPILLGLDVLGPGGGPWWLEVDDNGLRAFGPGLPAPDSKAPVVQLSIEDLAQADDVPLDAIDRFLGSIFADQQLAAAPFRALANVLCPVGQYEAG